jgi:biopolymer transport protein ExbD
MKINTGTTNNEPHIELVPLIDVIFCILTFFLLAGLQMGRQQAISVDIPNASTGAPAARELLMVSLNDAGQIFVEQQPMLIPGQLVEAVKMYRQARPNSSIVLYASKQVNYSKVVEVLDTLRGVAGDRVALATLPTNAVAPNPPILTNPVYGYPGAVPYNPYPGVPTSPYPAVAPTPAGSIPSQFDPPAQVSPTPAAQPVPAASPVVPTPAKSPKP